MEKSIILNSKKVSNYLNAIDSNGTREQYEVQLVDYFTWLNKHPDDYITDPRKLRIKDPEAEIEYLDGIERDIQEYIQRLNDMICKRTNRPYAPTTKAHRIYTVKNFFEWHHIELSKHFWIDFKRKHNGVTIIIEDISPTQEQVQKLLQAGDIREKAVILCQISSGCRIGELLDIRSDDLHWDDFERCGVLLVEIRSDNKGNKTKKTRIVFFSSEAIEYLKLWLERERKKYLELSIKKAENLGLKMKNDDRIFPFTTKSWRDNSWIKLLRHTGMDWKDSIGHYKFRTHSLRKYFKKKAGKYDIQFMNQLIGHGGFERRYSDITDKKEFCNEIKKLEEYVTIKEYVSGETKEQVEHIQIQLNEREEKIHNLEQMMNEMKAQITELRLEKLEKFNGKKPPSS